MVYFICCVTTGAIKIGSSEDPEYRLDALQTANPNPLFLLGTVPGGETEEAALHSRFGHLRIAGEWFEAKRELTWYIRKAIWRQEGFAPPPKGVSTRDLSAIRWIEDRFRERREWKSEDLKRVAIDSGLTLQQVFKNSAIQSLPIQKKPRTTVDGGTFWAWIAREGWPSEPALVQQENGTSH